MLPLILAMALTDSRTAYFCVPAGIAIMAFVCIINRYQIKQSDKKIKKRAWFSWIIGIICMFAIFILLVFGIMQITPLFNQIRNNGVFATAIAESTTEANQGIAHRGLTVLSGRSEVWGAAIQYLKENPILLFIGGSKLGPIRGFETYLAHVHCLYIQVLLESGIPGLLLILSFMGYTGIHAIRLIQHIEQPLWIRLLPAIVISLWIGDIAEMFTWLRTSQCPMIAVCFICAGTINHYGSKTSHKIKI